MVERGVSALGKCTLALPALSRLAILPPSATTTRRERNRRERSPRERTPWPRLGTYFSRPVYDAAMMEPSSGVRTLLRIPSGT